MGELVFEPVVPGAAIVGLVALVTALLTAQGRRPPPGGSFRTIHRARACTALAALGCLSVLANPTWLEVVDPPAGRNRLIVLVDTSRSMGLHDADGHARLDVARDLATRIATRSPPGTDVDVLPFDHSAYRVGPSELSTLTADGDVTDIAAALKAGIAGSTGERRAIVILSDGAHNAPEGLDGLLEVLQTVRARGVPVFTVPLGGPVRVADVSVALEGPEEIILAGQQLHLSVHVRHQGFPGQAVNVEAWCSGRVLSSQAFVLPVQGPSTVTLPLPSFPPGVHELEIHVPPVASEVVTGNNTRTFVIHVLEDPVRLLVLEGKPYWDLPFLVRELAARRGIEVTSGVRLGPARVLIRTTSWSPSPVSTVTPANDIRSESVRVEKEPTLAAIAGPGGLDRHHIVVLGRDADDFLTPESMAHLKVWISRRGGTLLCARGRPATAVAGDLAPILPLRWDHVSEGQFRLEWTSEGRALRLIPGPIESVLAATTVLATSDRAVGAGPLTTVLARASGFASGERMPVMATQPYGLGRVVVVEGSGMWRMVLRRGASDPSREAHQVFWGGLVRWIVTSGHMLPGIDISIRPERSPIVAGDPVRLLIQRRPGTSDPAPAVVHLELAGEATRTRKLQAVPVGGDPDILRADAGPLEPGRHRAELQRAGGPAVSCRVDVVPPDGEALDPSARREVLERIARDTGGEVLIDPDPDHLQEACRRAWALAFPVRHRRIPAWDRPALLIAIVGTWATGWFLRRREGLT